MAKTKNTKQKKTIKSNDTQSIKIELNEDMAQGTYSNLAVISHSSSEFIVDFIRVLPGIEKAKVKSRIILSPNNAKRLLFSLGSNIEKFEQLFGEIETQDNVPNGADGNQTPPIPMNFGMTQTEA